MRKSLASSVLALLLFSGPRLAAPYETVKEGVFNTPLSKIVGDPSKEGTHAKLTWRTITLFESHYEITLSATIRRAIMLGSIEEDYDVFDTASLSSPPTDLGTWQSILSDPVPALTLINRTENHFSPRLNYGFMVHYPWNEDAIDWAINSTANYMDWSDAVAAGDTELGWRRLGHVLHILQDLCVPEHTRNDYHGYETLQGEVSYEAWVNQLPDATFNALSSSGPPTQFADVRSLLVFLQSHTHSNYFSADTVFKGQHHGITLTIPPHAEEAGTDYFVNTTLGNRLCKRSSDYDGLLEQGKDPATAKLACVLDTSIYSQSAALLRPKAVSVGANLIKLFHSQVTSTLSPPSVSVNTITPKDLGLTYYVTPTGGTPTPTDTITITLNGTSQYTMNITIKNTATRDERSVYIERTHDNSPFLDSSKGPSNTILALNQSITFAITISSGSSGGTITIETPENSQQPVVQLTVTVQP